VISEVTAAPASRTSAKYTHDGSLVFTMPSAARAAMLASPGGWRGRCVAAGRAKTALLHTIITVDTPCAGAPGKPAPVKQGRSGVAGRAGQDRTGGQQWRGLGAEVQAQQRDHPGEAQHQPGELPAGDRFGPDQPQRQQRGEQRVGGDQDAGR